MKKTMSRAVAVLMFLSVILTACGEGASGDKNTAADTSAESAKKEAAKADSGPVELVFYSNSTDSVASFDERFGNPLRKKFPNFQIKYIQKTKDVTFPDLIAAGQQIDIYWESVGQFLAGIKESNIQYDMTGLIKKHNVDLSRFEPTTIDAMKAISGGSKLYGLPVTNNTLSLFYNKDLFDKFGVAYPKDGMTWDDVLALSKKMTRTSDGKQYIGLGISQSHLLRLNPFSVPFVDPKTSKATINSEKWRTIYDYAFVKPEEAPGFRELIRAEKAMPASKSFTENKEMALYVFLTTLIFSEGLPHINWDMVSFPTYKELPKQGPQTYPTYFSVTSTSKHKDEAMEAIKYLTSDENQLWLSKQGNMPVLKNPDIQNAFGQETEFKDKNLKSVFLNKFAPISPKTEFDSAAEGIYRANITKVSLGEMDLNTMLRQAEEETNKKIEEEKSK